MKKIISSCLLFLMLAIAIPFVPATNSQIFADVGVEGPQDGSGSKPSQPPPPPPKKTLLDELRELLNDLLT